MPLPRVVTVAATGDNREEGLRYPPSSTLDRRGTMRSIKTFLKSKDEAEPTVLDFRDVGRRHLTEYILNLAMTALAHGDLTPIYENYMDDPRLADEDRDELARAYLLLNMAATQDLDQA